MPFGRTNLFVPSHFWTTYAKYDNALGLYSDLWKNISVHIYVLGPKVLRRHFIEISLLSIRSSAHDTFPPIFGLFTICDPNITEIVAPPDDESDNL